MSQGKIETTAANLVVDAAFQKAKRFSSYHSGMSWIEFELAPRLTGENSIIPGSDVIPWDSERWLGE